jgi:site-specific DNA-methyltransferase (adenine-specific)/modification methylase
MSRVETIGDATLYLGDCRDILPTLGKVDAVVTDPPYGIGFAAQPTKWQRRAGQAPEAWDDDVIAELEAIRAHGDLQIIWGGNYYTLPPSRGWLSWFKPDAPPSMASVELAWTNQNRNSRQITYSIGQTNAERVGHPTQKPLAVMAWCLAQFPAAQTVLDPFMGSGTTGVACVATGRTFTSVEIDQRYFDIACRRIEEAYRQPRLFAEPVAKPVQPSMFMTLIARLSKLITLDLTRTPAPAPTPKPKVDTRAAHYALEQRRAAVHAELRAAVKP